MEKGKRRTVVRKSPKNKLSKNVTKTIKSKVSKSNNRKYGTVPKKSTLVVERLKRDLRRTRTSASYRIGNTIINSLIKPWKLILLPFRLIKISWDLANERLGIKNPPNHDSVVENKHVNKKTIVVFPTNGVGFGHFTRILAIAKRMKKIDEEM